ncbi:small ribosomal subunit Rsm22 family protein [Pseudochelatococcus sp. B33]
MELPAPLKRAVDAALEGHAAADLARAASALSARYRAEVRDGAWHLAEERAALAYLATRLPATYAAVRAALAHVAQEQPDFAPVSLLDVGAGPGTALWAAADLWPSCRTALMIEGSDTIRRWGERLSAPLAGKGGASIGLVWRSQDLLDDTAGVPGRHDLVTMAYVLDEIADQSRAGLIDRLWARTQGVLVIVEPGTPAGFRRVADVRTRLIAAGGCILAPCPHALPCPITAPDWCHFSQRVARSRLHRLLKSGDVPWEDEKYAYVAASRLQDSAAPRRTRARVLAPPRAGRGHIGLKLCEADGGVAQRTVSRRDGDAYRQARRADWGDGLS